MNEGERLIWAAAYANALSWPYGGNFDDAVSHAWRAVTQLRSDLEHLAYDDSPHVEAAREMIEFEQGDGSSDRETKKGCQHCACERCGRSILSIQCGYCGKPAHDGICCQCWTTSNDEIDLPEGVCDVSGCDRDVVYRQNGAAVCSSHYHGTPPQ